MREAKNGISEKRKLCKLLLECNDRHTLKKYRSIKMIKERWVRVKNGESLARGGRFV